MLIPEGTLCSTCEHYFWVDKGGRTKTFCKGCEQVLWEQDDFIIGGTIYDVPLVHECTQYKKRAYGYRK